MSWDPSAGRLDTEVQDGGGDVGLVLRPAVPHAKLYEATLALDVDEASVRGAQAEVYACIGRAAEAADGSEPVWTGYSCKQVIETEGGGFDGVSNAPSSLPAGAYAVSSELCVWPGDVVAAFLAVHASTRQRPLLTPLQEPEESEARFHADITSFSLQPRVAAHCRSPR